MPQRPNTALHEALFQQAVKFHQSQKFLDAKKLYEKIIVENPKHFAALHYLGVIQFQMGDASKSVELITRSIKIQPNDAAAYINRGISQITLGKPSEALLNFRKAIQLRPHHSAAHCYFGISLCELDRHAEAIGHFDAAINLNSNSADAFYNKGKALAFLGKNELALACFDRSIELNPLNSEAHFNRGNAMTAMRRFLDAVESYDRAISLNPADAKTYANRGDALRLLRRYEESLECYNKAIELKPNFTDAFQGRATLNSVVGRLDNASSDFGQVLQIEASEDTLALPFVETCKLLVSVDNIPAIYATDEELESVRSRLEMSLSSLNLKLQNQVERNKAIDDVSRRAAFHLTGFYIAYQQKNDRAVMTLLSEALAKTLHSEMDAANDHKANPGPIRLGIASQNLLNHNGANWAYHWLAQLPKDYEFFTYSLSDETDHLSEKFSELGTHRHLTFDQRTYTKTLDVMKNDKLDFLMLPDVGMSNASRAMSVHRIAPVQFTAWGHPVTTGSRAVDYFLSSDLMEPENAQDHYSEQLVRLPNLALYLTPTLKPIPTSKNFGLPDNRILYGCLQSIFKYLPKYDQILPRIAVEVPKALFVFLEGEPPYITKVLQDRLKRAFEKFGLDVERHAIFLPRLNSNDYGLLIAQMDILVDSVGWSGGNTSLRSIEAGVPLVTLSGEFMRGRHTHAMYKMMGLDELISSSIDEYVSKLVALGLDSELRKHMTSQILSKKEVLYEDRKFISALDQFLKSRIRTC